MSRDPRRRNIARLVAAVAAPAICAIVTVQAVAAAGAPPASAAPRKAFAAAPGPDAEYLLVSDRYELRADGETVHERHSRLRVNSYLAINRKYGESKVEYDPAVDSFEVLGNATLLPSGARVTAPANAIVDDQPPGAEHDPLWSGLRRKVIVHTALEPGAVIEESWRVTRAKGDLPWLELSTPAEFEPPVLRREVQVDVPAGAPFRWQAVGVPQAPPVRERTAGRDVWRWRIENAAAFPPEPGAPAEAPAIIASTCPSREALAAELNRRAAIPGGAPEGLVALARRVDAANPGDEARLVAVLDAVAQAVTVAPLAPSQQRWRPRALAEVWRAGVATPLELAGLQAAALHAVGFSNVSPAVVGSDERDIEKCPALAGLERPVVFVRQGNRRLYDPARPLEGGPLELVTGLRSLLPVFAFDAMPENPEIQSATLRGARLTLAVAADGGLKGALEFNASGAATPHAALVRDPAKVARELGALLPEGKVSSLRVTELRRASASFTADVEGRLPGRDALGLVVWTLPDLPGGLDEKLPPLPAPGRLAPVALPAPSAQQLEIALTLPAGWKVEALPESARAETSTGTAEIHATIESDGTVTLGRRLELRVAEVPAINAADLHALLVAWRSPAGRELILRPPVDAASKAAAGTVPAAR